MRTSEHSQDSLCGESAESNRSHEKVHSISEQPITGDAHENEAPQATWQPFWLRTPILGVFFGVFLMLTLVFSVLLVLTQSNDGLVETRKNMQYFWRFIPTAILTVINLFFSRVELQALRYMPWMCLKHPQTALEVFNLQYTSMFQPNVLIRSIKRKDMIVALVVISSLILKVQVVLSPGLFQIASRQALHPVQVETVDNFDITTDKSDDTSLGPFHHAEAIRRFDMDYPFGVAKGLAYQTFQLPNEAEHVRGTADNPLQVVVDGIVINTQCHQLENYTVATELDDKNKNLTIYNFDLQFQGCDKPISYWVTHTPETNNTAVWAMTDRFKNHTRGTCLSLPQEFPHILNLGCYFDRSAETDPTKPVATCAGVVCSSGASLTKVEVIDNGVSPNLTVLPNQTATPINSSMWNMMVHSIPESHIGSFGPESWGGGMDWDDILGPLASDARMMGESRNTTDKSIYQSSIVEQAFMNLTEYIGPFIAHYQLRQDSSAEASGSSTSDLYRLRLHKNTAISMTVLSGVSALVAIWILFQSKKTTKIWHRDPATILGSMTFFNSNGQRDDMVQMNSSDSKDKIKEEWSHSNDCPLVLRRWFRAMVTCYALGLIGSLAAMLRVSQTSQGLATVGEGKYLSLLWTSLPAFAMFLVTLYTNAVDTAIRDLSSISKLSTHGCSVKELDMSLLDMMGFRALYQSLRSNIHTVTLSQSLVFLCAFLTTMTSLLFTPTSNPGHSHIEFAQQSWFGTRKQNANDKESVLSDDPASIKYPLRSLILTHGLSNFTYPEFTHADLVFPSLEYNQSGVSWEDDKSITVHTPAAKLVPTCRQMNDGEIKTVIGERPISKTDRELYASELGIDVEAVWGISHNVSVLQGYNCPVPDGDSEVAQTLQLQAGGEAVINDIIQPYTEDQMKGNVYIGGVLNSPEFVNSLTCGTPVGPTWTIRTYFWGNFSTPAQGQGRLDYYSAWKCNYSWSEVAAEVQLTWANGRFRIDRNNPPIVDNSTVRPWDPPFDIPTTGETAVIKQYDDVFPEFKPVYDGLFFISQHFPTIVEPYGPIKAEDFGTPGQESRILDALHYTFGIAGAQLANKMHRLRLDEQSATSPSTHGTLNPVKATVANSRRQRVVQNPIISAILIAILSLVVLVNLFALISGFLSGKVGDRGWLLDMELKGTAPDGFSSIASMNALLDGSNARCQMPSDAHLMSPSQLHERFKNATFRAGWFTKEGDWEGEAVYTIGVPTEDFQYLGMNRIEDAQDSDTYVLNNLSHISK